MARRNWTVIVAIIVLGGLLAAPAAVMAGDSADGTRWWRAPQVIEALELTPSETRELDELFLGMRRRAIELKAESQAARLEVDVLFDREVLDQAAVARQFERIVRAKAERARVRNRFLLEVRQLLGPKRFRVLKGIYEERKRALRQERRDSGG